MVSRYAMRMDYVSSDLTKLSTWLSLVALVFLVVHETHSGENPHVHIVFDSDKKLSALRMSFKRAFQDKIGNGAYSLKECDDDVEAYMRYMCKGDSVDDQPVILLHQGLDFTEEKVKDAHEAYWVNNDALRSNKRKRHDLKEAGTVVEKIERIAKADGVRASDREGIAKIYIRLYKDARKPINTFAARAVVNTVQILLDDTGFAADDLARSIAAS